MNYSDRYLRQIASYSTVDVNWRTSRSGSSSARPTTSSPSTTITPSTNGWIARTARWREPSATSIRKAASPSARPSHATRATTSSTST
jgi:hypothetical protein